MKKHYTIKKYLLSDGLNNAKTKKNHLKTKILYLSASTQNYKGRDLCPYATDACRLLCLVKTGHAEHKKSVGESRINRSNFFIQDRVLFLTKLLKELSNANKLAKKNNSKIAIRLNGTSDVDFVQHIRSSFGIDILTEFENLTFYDYTKSFQRVKKYMGSNYRLTLSYSGENFKDIIEAINMGINVSVVFEPAVIDKINSGDIDTWAGMRIVSGDENDLEMILQDSKILALKFKGSRTKLKYQQQVQQGIEAGFVIPETSEFFNHTTKYILNQSHHLKLN